MLVENFGAVQINVLTAPTTKEDFVKLYIGKVPDVAKAWERVSEIQKGLEGSKVVKTKKKRSVKNG